jgi:tripartite-type tricarboxylate transporter receptor subunit TctC
MVKRVIKSDRLPGLCAIVLALSLPSLASAQSVEDFYKGRQINLIIGGGAGGGYDVYFRTLARHMGKHIPGNPSFIAKNQPAAGGLAAASAIYTTAEKDGGTIGAFANNVTMDPLFGAVGARYDPLKLNWLGSIGKQQSVCATWHESPIKRIEQAQEREVIVGAAGATSNTALMPKVLNALLDTKFRVIAGYDPAAGLTLSIERREVEGICGLSWSTMKASRPHWIKDKLLNVIVQLALQKLPELVDTPAALDIVKDPHKKRVLTLILLRQETGRPVAAPPGVPEDRLAALRRAFDATMKDPAFIAEAEKLQLEIEPMTGAEIHTMLAEAFATPKNIVAEAGELLTPPAQKK